MAEEMRYSSRCTSAHSIASDWRRYRIAGVVLEVNSALTSQPELVNNETYTNGWIAKVKLSNSADLDGAMDEAAYKKFLQDK